jgi:F-box/leucine-rich repeat protein 2/20
MVFFNLVSDLKRHILIVWLDLKGLANLDTAVCNNSLRGNYLENLCSFYSVYEGFDYRHSKELHFYWRDDIFSIINSSAPDSFYFWIHFRKIKINRISLNVESLVAANSCVDFHYVKQMYIHSIRGESNYNVLQDILLKCDGLTELHYLESRNVNILLFLSVACNKLKIYSHYKHFRLERGSSKIFGVACNQLEEFCGHRGSTLDCDVQSLTANCPWLTKVNFERCAITDNSLLCLSKHCRKLLSVNLGSCRIGDDAVEFFTKQHSSVTHLNINNCSLLTNETLCNLGRRCKSLKKLNLAGSELFSDVGMEHICDGCTLICDLVLSNCSKLTKHTAEMICVSLNYLSRIEFEQVNSSVSSEMLRIFIQKFQTVDWLDNNRLIVGGLCSIIADVSCLKENIEWSFCGLLQIQNLVCLSICIRQASTESLQFVLSRSPNLLLLHIQFATRNLSPFNCDPAQWCVVDDHFLIYLSNCCSILEDLRLPDHGIYGDIGVEALVKHNHRLKHISLQNCCNVSDSAVIEIGNQCSKLQYLNLESCTGGITDLSIFTSLSKFCLKLTYINLTNTMVTAKGRNSLLESCKGMRRVELKHVFVETILIE